MYRFELFDQQSFLRTFEAVDAVFPALEVNPHVNLNDIVTTSTVLAQCRSLLVPDTAPVSDHHSGITSQGFDIMKAGNNLSRLLVERCYVFLNV